GKPGRKDDQDKMPYSYSMGRGIPNDGNQSFFWSLKCAQQQDIECMFNVVGCYLEGRGTQKNLDSMIAWATRIALLDNPEDLQLSGQITSARANLATMYYDGQNVSKDLAKSYMWYLIYNENKRDFSVLEQQKNIETIQNLKSNFLSLIKTKQDLMQKDY